MILLLLAAIARTGQADSKSAYIHFVNCAWNASADVDRDGDDYIQSGSLTIDVDTDPLLGNAVASVYILISYRRLGTDQWIPFIQSGTFQVDGSSTADARTFPIGPGLPQDIYEFKLELFLGPNWTRVDEWHPSNAAALGNNHFESAAQDRTAISYNIIDCEWIGESDQDGDGYARNRRLSVIPVSSASPWVYLKIAARLNATQDWTPCGQTQPFKINAGTEQPQVFDIGGSPVLDRGEYEIKLEMLTLLNTVVKRYSYTSDADLDDIPFESPGQDTVGVPGTICFGGRSCLAEEGRKVKIPVNRLNGRDGAVSVSYSVNPKTAVAYVDFIPKMGILRWADGDDAPKTISVKVLQDGLAEGKEVFRVVLDDPDGGALTAPRAIKVMIGPNEKATKTEQDPWALHMASLTEALGGAPLAWYTSPLSPWSSQPDSGAASGPASPENASWLQTSVAGAGTLSFDWQVLGAGRDTCLLMVDGKVRKTLRPAFRPTREALTLGEGAHVVRWIFSGDLGLPGSASLARVAWAPAAKEE
jgi:hypothetical protein